MSVYSRFVSPYVMERFSAGHHVDEQRRLALASARGEVLEIGFGTGRNFSHYPVRVTHVTAVDCEIMRPKHFNHSTIHLRGIDMRSSVLKVRK